MKVLLKLRFSFLRHRWPLSILAILFRPFGLLQLSQTGIIKLSHSNYALTKYNIFCSLHNFILQCNMTIFYKTTHYMTKKLFCQLNHEYLPLQYFGDGFNKIGKNDKKQNYLSWIAVLFLNSFSHDISDWQCHYYFTFICWFVVSLTK
jgi:hypothetical protein